MLKQLSIFIQNEVGSISRVTQLLSDGGYSLNALSVYDTPRFNILRVLVDDADEVADYLESNGMLVRVTQVIAVALHEEVGYLDSLLQLLNRNDIQVQYLYTTLLSGEDNPVVVLDTSRREETEQVLRDTGYTLC